MFLESISGKELGNCTHQWTTNDDTKHTSAFDTKSSSSQRRKIDNNRRKKEAEKRTDEKEATKLNQRNFNKEYVIQNDVIQRTSKREYPRGSVISL